MSWSEMFAPQEKNQLSIKWTLGTAPESSEFIGPGEQKELMCARAVLPGGGSTSAPIGSNAKEEGGPEEAPPSWPLRGLFKPLLLSVTAQGSRNSVHSQTIRIRAHLLLGEGWPVMPSVRSSRAVFLS